MARALRSRGSAVLGVALLVALASASLLAEAVLPYGADEIDPRRSRMGPSLATGHVLGTDELGRDYLIRLLAGVRPSAAVALTVLVFSTTIGTCVGTLAGYWSGTVDRVLMRVADAVLTLPGLAVAVALAALVGNGSPWRLGLVLAALGWPLVARVVRARVASLRERGFVHAARGLGASNTHIVLHHILPNTADLVVVHATFVVPGAILAEAGISFLGLGVQPPTPTLGGLIAESRSLMLTDWWLVVFPGLVIALLCLAVNLVGESLRGALESRRS